MTRSYVAAAERKLLLQEQRLALLRQDCENGGRELATLRESDSGDEAGCHRLIEALSVQGELHHRNLLEVRGAIARIKGGTYGSCTRCQDSIDYQRLYSLVATRYCVACAEEIERTQRATGPS